MSSKRRVLWVEFVVIFLVASLGCERLFGIRTFRVPTGSMAPTIEKGQLIYVREVSTPSESEFTHGAVVVIRASESPDTVYARRVVGVPGDRIEVRPNSLLVNGHVVDEPYATWTEAALLEVEPNYKERLRDLFEVGPVPVPSGTVYVMCDNRLDGPDSRTFGPLPIEKVVGFVLSQK